MSSEQTFSTSDLRSTAQDYKRDAARKHKWALGAHDGIVGRPDEKPRPYRPSDDHFHWKRREVKAASARLKIARKQDMLEGTAVTDESSGSNSDDHEEGAVSPPEGIMFSFDAKRAPSQGSQILNVALAKAVERFEERETVKLVKDEYDILDATGEVVPQPSSARKSRKGKSKAVTASEPEVDEDYEFV